MNIVSDIITPNNNVLPLKQKIVHHRKPEPIFGQVIGRIASSHYHVSGGVIVEDILAELNKNPDISSIGVVDDAGSVIGVVARNMFFDILGRPFGRDLYKNRHIRSIAAETKRFKYTTNIFSVAEDLADDLNVHGYIYYILTGDDGRFFGVFSNRDLLIYLSQITQRDIGFAKIVQSSIIKEETALMSEYCEILAGTRMAKDVGGDHYMIRKYDESKWFFSICDVAGKGISASLLSVLLSGMNHMYDFSKGIRQFIVQLNDFIFASFHSEKFLTGIFVDFDEKSGRTTVYDAGHSYLCLYRNKKCVSLKSTSENLPIGITQAYQPASYSFTMKKDDVLMLYTDGMVEQSNPEGVRYGSAMLTGLITRVGTGNLSITKDAVFSNIHGFRKHQAQDDDMTILMLKYHGGKEAR